MIEIHKVTFFEQAAEVLQIFSLPLIIYTLATYFLLKKWDKKTIEQYKATGILPTKSKVASDVAVVFFNAGFISIIPMLFAGMGGVYGIIIILAFTFIISPIVRMLMFFLLSSTYLRKLHANVIPVSTGTTYEEENNRILFEKINYKKIFIDIILAIIIFSLSFIIGLKFFQDKTPYYNISLDNCFITINRWSLTNNPENAAGREQFSCISKKLQEQEQSTNQVIDCTWINDALQTSKSKTLANKTNSEYLLKECKRIQSLKTMSNNSL